MVCSAVIALALIASASHASDADPPNDGGAWSTTVVTDKFDTQKPAARGARRATGNLPEGRIVTGTAARGAAAADHEKPLGNKPSESAVQTQSKEGGAADDLVRRYCEATGEIADRARLEQERRELAAVAAEVESRVRALEAAVAEHKAWLEKRTAFRASVQESLVSIYSRMKPEAASAQVAEMESAAAAAILSRMDAKAAGTILAEIDPAKAGRIASVLAAVGQLEPASAPPAPKREGK